MLADFLLSSHQKRDREDHLNYYARAYNRLTPQDKTIEYDKKDHASLTKKYI